MPSKNIPIVLKELTYLEQVLYTYTWTTLRFIAMFMYINLRYYPWISKVHLSDVRNITSNILKLLTKWKLWGFASMTRSPLSSFHFHFTLSTLFLFSPFIPPPPTFSFYFSILPYPLLFLLPCPPYLKLNIELIWCSMIWVVEDVRVVKKIL